jgi:hypothetical protein
MPLGPQYHLTYLHSIYATHPKSSFRVLKASRLLISTAARQSLFLTPTLPATGTTLLSDSRLSSRNLPCVPYVFQRRCVGRKARTGDQRVARLTQVTTRYLTSFPSTYNTVASRDDALYSPGKIRYSRPFTSLPAIPSRLPHSIHLLNSPPFHILPSLPSIIALRANPTHPPYHHLTRPYMPVPLSPLTPSSRGIETTASASQVQYQIKPALSKLDRVVGSGALI